MTERSYLKKSIEELEAIFEMDGKDSEIRLHLLDELRFRNTQCALALKEKVLAANVTAHVPPEACGTIEQQPKATKAAIQQQECVDLSGPA